MGKFVESVSSLAFYLGIGALCHGVFLGPAFSIDSVWSWGWVLAWPAALFIKYFLMVLLGIVVVGLVCLLGVVAYDAYEKRQYRLIREKNPSTGKVFFKKRG